MAWMLISLVVLTSFLVLVTLLPLWRHPHWLIRSCDFPRLQFAALGLVTLVLQWRFLPVSDALTWVLLLAAGACTAWHVRAVLPWTLLWKKEVPAASQYEESRCVSLITANVLAPNRDADRLLAQVRKYKPDILVTLESDAWWQEQLDSLKADMPHTIKCPLDNLYGMHVYSRLPLEEAEISRLVMDDIPSMHALLRLRSGDGVRVHFLHPMPPSPSENDESSERDAELVMVARSVAKAGVPVIVAGDLNDVAWSPTTRLFRKISGLVDPRVGRGMFNTFHAHYPFLRWPLDHLFHSKDFEVVAIERLPATGSDHFALYTRLYLAPDPDGGAADDDGLDADAEDREWAQEIVDEEPVRVSDVPTPGEGAR